MQESLALAIFGPWQALTSPKFAYGNNFLFLIETGIVPSFRSNKF